MRYKTLFLLSPIFCSSIAIHAQSKSSLPHTLLWRISGNGLSKNSFVYGTMHLKDKRLFYFTDSLYQYLSQVDGYALEVDVQEFMDSVIQKVISQKEEDMSKDDDVKEDKQFIDSLMKELKIGKSRASRKMLEKLRQRKVRSVVKKQEMPTIVDAYLYGIARRQGKWLGGIEDVQDQLAIFDELGNDVQSRDLLAPDAQLAKSLEEMISIYLSQDLNAIENYSLNRYTDEFESKLLFQRNKKMVLRMDSLSSIRSMFFAVGAAHLPGDSGVITLLRKKGYTVDPVFSATKVDPLQYTSKLAEVPWIKVEDADKTYEVQMPDKPSDVTMFGDYVKMKICIDITTLTYFMSGSVASQQDIDPEKALQQIAKDKENRIENKRKIESNGIKGIEAFMFSGGYYYKLQYLVKGKMLYMLMAGSDKKEAVNSPALKKFFASFVPKDIPQEKKVQKEWQQLAVEDKAFDVMLPGVPKRNKSIEKSAEKSNWTFTVYDLNDIASSVYYLVQVRDLVPGFFLTGDSAFFSLFRESLPKEVNSITKEERTTVASFPAYRFEAGSTEEKLIYKVLIVNRGNRVYILMAVAERKEESLKSIDRFFNSFTLKNYKETAIKKEWSPEKSFYSSVSYPFREKESDEEEEESGDDGDSKHYVSFNPEQVISYEVFKTPLSRYYWVESDSLYFEKVKEQYKSYEHSVIEERLVTNGRLKGKEWVIQMPQNNNLKRVRYFLNGDTAYTLISFIPSQYINDERHRQFFDGFRVANETIFSTIYQSKAKKLLTDLLSKDTALFEEASSALVSAEFSKEDKPLLEEAMLADYADDTASNYYTTRDRIMKYMDVLADDATVEFIRKHFGTLKGEREHIKFDLLTILASYKTAYSYSTLKELLLKHTPVDAREKKLSYRIMDSLPLTKTLYPELLTLSNNTLFAQRIIEISRALADSNYISIAMLAPYKENFLYTADTTFFDLAKKDKEEYWGGEYADMINLLDKFNDEDCNMLLKKYLSLDNLEIKKEIIINLFKNEQVVSEKEIEKLAADKEYRRELHNKLKEIGKEKFFPGKYLTQKYMAESDIYSAAIDDEDVPSEVKFLTDKTFMYKGSPKKFYLYKVTYEYENEDGEKNEYVYLGIAGPYAETAKNVETDNDATGLYYEEEFDSKKVNSQFEAYIKSLTENGKEEE